MDWTNIDWKTVGDLVFSVAIVLFACLTWLSTKTYAYVTGVTLFIQANKDLVGNAQNPDPAVARATMKALRKRYPRVYKDMRDCINPATRRQIEG